MPAFDLEQQPESGALRGQEMIVGLEGKRSSFENALSAAAEFGLRPGAARERLRSIVDAAASKVGCALEAAGLNRDAGAALLGNLLLN